MTIQIFEFGRYLRSFDDSNEVEVKAMAEDISSPYYDGAREYIDEDGHWICRWPLDCEEEEEHEYSRVGIDFSPSCPWDAPGMSVSDFIR